MNKIYAGIVTFNPDTKLLETNVKAILHQVHKIIIVDNGSKNYDLIVATLKNLCNDSIVYIHNDYNCGIAKALNQAMEFGANNDYEWMLALDQDSICPNNYVEIMKKYLSIEPKIGIAAPIIFDRKVGVIGHNPKESYKKVRTCITSGSFSKLSAWKTVGGYDERMFIDFVDFEYCYKLRKAGYKVIQTSEVSLEHSLGDGKVVSFLGLKIRDSEHNAFRCYYIAQNNIYYPKKHHLWLRLLRGNLRNIKHVMMISLYEEDKKSKIKAIIKGWINGYRLKPGD